MKKNVLGKGLSALIPESYVKETNVSTTTLDKGFGISTGMIDIDPERIQPNPDQPRQILNDDTLSELADSIREKGIIQPIIVKKKDEHGNYELICGERRLVAAKRLGLTLVPAIVKDIASEDLLETALIENIQREDLNPIEEAEAYMKLQERGLAHEEIAKKVGRNRTTVVNILRLLKLPKEILRLIIEKRISEGHARTLLSLPTVEYQVKLAKRIIEEDLSVRQVEEIVKRKTYQRRPAKRLRKIDAQIVDLERKLEDTLGSKVRIFAGKSKGRIEIRYFSLDDLDRILTVLGIHVD